MFAVCDRNRQRLPTTRPGHGPGSRPKFDRVTGTSLTEERMHLFINWIEFRPGEIRRPILRGGLDPLFPVPIASADERVEP